MSKHTLKYYQTIYTYICTVRKSKPKSLVKKVRKRSIEYMISISGDATQNIYFQNTIKITYEYILKTCINSYLCTMSVK